MSNYKFHKKDIYPRTNTGSKIFTCVFEGCGFTFKRANKKYCPEHSEYMRLSRHRTYEERQAL